MLDLEGVELAWEGSVKNAAKPSSLYTLGRVGHMVHFGRPSGCSLFAANPIIYWREQIAYRLWVDYVNAGWLGGWTS